MNATRLSRTDPHRVATKLVSSEHGGVIHPLAEPVFPIRNARWFDDRSNGGRYTHLLVATPHHHRDVSRLKDSYNPTPNWLYIANESLSDEAAAVICTYPRDVEEITSKLLPSLGFPGPYTVLPSRRSTGITTPHAKVMVVTTRPHVVPSADLFFPSPRHQHIDPEMIAEKLVQPDAPGLFLFAQDDVDTLHFIREPRRGWGIIHDGWGPWDE